VCDNTYEFDVEYKALGGIVEEDCGIWIHISTKILEETVKIDTDCPVGHPGAKDVFIPPTSDLFFGTDKLFLEIDKKPVYQRFDLMDVSIADRYMTVCIYPTPIGK
jgi:hypothetical protein